MVTTQYSLKNRPNARHGHHRGVQLSGLASWTAGFGWPPRCRSSLQSYTPIRYGVAW